MHDLSRGDDGVRSRQTKPAVPRTLKSVLVRYESRTDRRTVFPMDCRDDRVLTTWLSADADAFVDLGESR
jgi:hypothetical protein